MALRASSVGSGPVQPQLVGLPQQVEQLGEPAVGRARRRWRRRGSAAGGLGVELVGDGAQLRQDRPAGRLGRVGGEDRPDGEPAGGGGDLLGRHAPLGDQLGGLVQPAAVRGPPPAQLAGPVHLFGDVGQVEVGGEGAGQLGAGGDVQRRRAGARPPPASRRTRARISSTRSSSGRPSWRARVWPSRRAEAADVGAQGGVGPVVVVLVGHRALLASSTEDSAVRLAGSYPCRLVDADEFTP